MMKQLRHLFGHIDPVLLFMWLGIMVYGWVILTSASMPYANFHYHDSWFFVIRQSIFIVIGLFMWFMMFIIAPNWWYRWRHALLFGTIAALLFMLLPGVGHVVKGSMRWIRIGIFNLQVSECSKLTMILYISGFISKHHWDIKNTFNVFFRPIAIISLVASLILLEPDFGTVCVMLLVTLFQLFVSGAKFRYVGLLISCVSFVLLGVAVSAPYRVKRLMSFMDPWSHQDAESYQLVHSLMAVSAGGWFGSGLGESMEKLFYLPEAHTDFLFAILAEELGLVGMIVLLAMFFILLARIWMYAYIAYNNEDIYSGSVLVGIASWWGLQTLINVGVNLGCLPTKGITLPFISYGGSSMVVCCAAMGLVMRCAADIQMRSHKMVKNES